MTGRKLLEDSEEGCDMNGLTLCMGSPAAVWGAGRGKGLSVGIGPGRAVAAPGQGTGYHVCWGRGSG